MISIEDLVRHWQALQVDPLRAGRNGLGCELHGAVSTRKLATIRSRTIALNDAIARVCFQHSTCMYDAGARFHMPLRATYFSSANPQYLSIAGQRALAAIEWKPALALASAFS